MKNKRMRDREARLSPSGILWFVLIISWVLLAYIVVDYLTY